MIVLMVIYNTRWCAVSFVNLKIWPWSISESFGYIFSDKPRDFYRTWGLSLQVDKYCNSYFQLLWLHHFWGIFSVVSNRWWASVPVNPLKLNIIIIFLPLMSMQCYTNATSIMSTMITCVIVASIPILPLSLLILL